MGALARVPGTPWWVAVGLPEASLAQDARSPLIRSVAVGGGLVALAAGAAWVPGHRLTRQVRQVARGEAGPALAVSELRELDRQRRRRERDLHDARHDALTGPPGRALFEQQAQALQSRAQLQGWGVAQVSRDALQEAADRAMRRATAAGKNRVAVDMVPVTAT